MKFWTVYLFVAAMSIFKPYVDGFHLVICVVCLQVYSSSLVDVERDFLSIDKRYPRLFVSAEFSKVSLNLFSRRYQVYTVEILA